MAKNDTKKLINEDSCIGCGICVSVCTINTKLSKADDFNPDTADLAIVINNGAAVIGDSCITCGICLKTCPIGSLSVVEA